MFRKQPCQNLSLWLAILIEGLHDLLQSHEANIVLFTTSSRLTGAHPASYPMGNGDSFPRDKAVGA